MFRFFKPKKVVATASPLQEKAASVVVAKVLWIQSKWALFMDRRVNKLSVRSKKFGLMVFVGLSLLICSSILLETFTGTYHKSSLQIGKIRKQVLPHDEIVSSSVPTRQYNMAVAFLHYMDSLATVSGRRVYDSINHVRPGLLDSAKVLEKLYHKNK